MARPKKTTNKKVTRKATPKKAAPKTKVKAKPKTTNAKAKKANQSNELQLPVIRRPDPNLPPSPHLIDEITHDLLTIIEVVEEYAANLRALDRMRHNGVGMKRLGFIEAAFRISTNFPQYFPHWLSTAKFKADIDLFNSIRSLVEACRSLEEKVWNISPKTKGGKRTLNKSTVKPCRYIMSHSVAPTNAAVCNKAKSPLGDRQYA